MSTKRASTHPRIQIIGEGHDQSGKRYFKLSVSGSAVDIPPFSMDQLVKPKALWIELNDAGANLFTTEAQNQLLAQLQRYKRSEPSFRVASRLGWDSGAFVLGNEIIGTPDLQLERSFRHLDHQMLAKYWVKGTLRDWQKKIGHLCVGNSRLMFVVSLAFTGPILALVKGPRSGGFQLFGDAETGKSTAGMVAGSIWGCHRSSERREKGFMESWHTTAGQVELTALAHNHTLLVLDETKRAGRNDKERGRVVLDISFNLAEQTERERMNNSGPVRAWAFYFLSTSNYSLEELASRAGLEIDDAERGRLSDIPCPNAGHGLYEDLHDVQNGEALSDALRVQCRKYFGSPGRIFCQKLALERAKRPRRLRRFLADEREAYRTALDEKVDGQDLQPLKRVSSRYATVFAAGSLAIQYGILPWKRRELLRAILACQLDGLRSERAHTSPAASISTLRSKLIGYMRQQGSQFLDLDQRRPQLGTHKLGSAPGYLATFKGKKWIYLTDDQLKAIIGEGKDADLLKNKLAEAHLLDRKNRGFVVQRPIYSGGKGNKNYAWVHAFAASIVKAEEA